MTIREPQDSMVESPPGRNYMAVRRDAPTETISRYPDSSHHGSDPVRTSYSGDRNIRRQSEQVISANAQTDAAKDANQPAQHALPSRMSRLCITFVSIAMGNYSKLLLFILENKAIVSQGEIDSLISSAREEQRLGHEINAQTFVHHALLLRKCKELDDKERMILFKRLDDINSETRRDFVSSIRTVHTHIKGSARTSAQTPQDTHTRSHGRGLPFEYQAGAQASRHGAERPAQARQSATAIQSDDPRARLAQDESTASEVCRPVPRVQTNDGIQVYFNESGRSIRPESPRHESNRSGARDHTDEVSNSMARMNMAETTPRAGRTRDTRSVGSEDPARHVEGAKLAKKAASIPEDRRMSLLMPGGGREFKGTEGDSEILDPRTYPSHPCGQCV
jgi:Cdc37 Hsp90 binding domain